MGTKTKISAMLAALYASYGNCLPEYDDRQHTDISMFQRNSPKGMCVKCLGKGIIKWIDADRMFADQSQHICEVACDLGKRERRDRCSRNSAGAITWICGRTGCLI